MSNNSVLPTASSLTYKMLLVESSEFRAMANELEEVRLRVKDVGSIRNIEWITRIPITSKTLLVRSAIMELLPAAVELAALLKDKNLNERASKALYTFMSFINEALMVVSDGEKAESSEDEDDEDEW